LLSCGWFDTPVHQIRFSAAVGDQTLSCADGPVALRDLRLFVHDPVLLRADGTRVPATFVVSDWQTERVALLDLEDGSGTCVDGTARVHDTLALNAPEGPYEGLELTLGVPADLNHEDPARAPSPLNLGAMSWGWLNGYKFLRFEARQPDGGTVQVHLGSTDCTGGMHEPTVCATGNRPTLSFAGDPLAGTRVIDLAPLLVRSEDGECMGRKDDPDCRDIFAAVGLDATGATVGRYPLR
jgi:uncharacterized repeat protein (TIGR04052 family)